MNTTLAKPRRVLIRENCLGVISHLDSARISSFKLQQDLYHWLHYRVRQAAILHHLLIVWSQNTAKVKNIKNKNKLGKKWMFPFQKSTKYITNSHKLKTDEVKLHFTACPYSEDWNVEWKRRNDKRSDWSFYLGNGIYRSHCDVLSVLGLIS